MNRLLDFSLAISVFLSISCVQIFAQDSSDTSTSFENLTHSHDDFDGFISFKDYGRNLYENPRGIGCNRCHGKKGEGSVIAHYSHKGKAKTLKAPSIKNLEFGAFMKALRSKKIGVMPTYYLTDKEIEAIYFFLYE